ncbi:molybdenum cofactor biosynthesis protein MoaE [Rhodovibrio salinarum]|uniref:Molybdopterin synthase catalytic subunit n=1 Tax=Rhodovibrio salinarum TaxID=1087 RepID=A0A934QL36_9PROT|nr:molybdenum cofactor biosynthesis protein MoaE [Rhodovibrio salinarum]MBK1698913.1 molybdenum cofactor biosynthesis protein MoaE [Rhodovibrio salinarum]
MIRVQREDFDVGTELAALTQDNPGVGGMCSFVGLVRDLHPDARTPGAESGEGRVTAMTLEHYPGMTEKMLERIDAEAHRRWPIEASLVIHRFGRMEPGERIVLVATASAHRQAAFDSCQFLIDWLKTKAPFWKLEETPDGGRWVDARDSDDTAASRWGSDDWAAE